MARRGGGDWSIDSKVYVGGLPDRADRYEIEEIFTRYGPLRNVWVARNPPGFAFVEFEDPRDAQDAVRALDGTRMCGVRARVELSSGKSRRGGGRGGGGGFGGGRGGGSYGGGGRDDYRGGGRPYESRDRFRDSYRDDDRRGKRRSRSPIPRRSPPANGRSRSRSHD